MTGRDLDIARQAKPERSVMMVSVRTSFGILGFGVVWFAFLRGGFLLEFCESFLIAGPV
jgi:hypothetical protein